MAYKKLERYRGRLTPEGVVAGMNAARNNPLRLLSDAELLFEHGRYPSAVVLAILSIEETGKLAILRMMALESDRDKVEQVWADYRSHRKKNVFSVLPEVIRKGVRGLEDLRVVYDPQAAHPLMTEDIKQVATYTTLPAV